MTYVAQQTGFYQSAIREFLSLELQDGTKQGFMAEGELQGLSVLTRLHFKNFKSWPEANIRFGRITGLFGSNSSGKSSILQFLLMLKQTKSAADPRLVLDFGQETRPPDLGSFRSVIHSHNEKLPLWWSLGWNFPYTLRIGHPEQQNVLLVEGNDITQESEVRWKGKALYTHHLGYEFSGHRFEFIPGQENSDEYGFAISPDLQDFSPRRQRGRPGSLPGPIKTHRFPDQVYAYFTNLDFLGEFEWQYEECLDRIYYLGPLREYPKRQYVHTGGSPADVGSRGQLAVSAMIAGTAENEKYKLIGTRAHQPFQTIIAHHLKEMGLVHDFQIREIAQDTRIHHVILKQSADGPEALLTDVGFGVSQVLPVLVLLYHVPKGSTILLEQPEIHLHPSVQSALADVIIEASQTRHLQIIVESHSEHLLRRLQRRAAERWRSHIAPSDLCLYFCDSKEGISSLEDLAMDDNGRINNWPADFFGDGFGEIAATQKAILARQAPNLP